MLRHHPGSAQRLRPRRERGETLIELMVAIVLLGTGIAAILSGLLALTKVTDSTAQATRANLAAQSLAEQIEQPVTPPTASNPATVNFTYIPCGTPADYNAAYPVAASMLPSGTQGTGWTAAVTKVEYATAATVKTVGSRLAFGQPTCNANVTYQTPTGATVKYLGDNDFGIQRITITVSSGARAHPAVETVVIIKRQTACLGDYSNSYQNLDQGPC